MAELPRATDMSQDFLDSLVSDLGTRVDVRPLSRWNVLGAGLAALSSRINKVAVDQFDASVLARATGSGLDDYCNTRSLGQVIRFPAVKARGTVTLERVSAGAGAGTVVAGTEIRIPNAADGRSYVFEVKTDSSIGASALSFSPAIEAQAAGAAASVGDVVSGLALTGVPGALFDPLLLPTAASVTMGADAETDDELRTRMEQFLLGKKGAIFAAVAFGALLVNGVKHVVLADGNDPHLGAQGVVYVGDVNWQSNETMLSEVAASLESWRGMGAATQIRGITQSDVTVTATITMSRPIAFYNASAIKNAAIHAALDYFDGRVDPYTYNPTSLAGRLERVHEEIQKVTVAAPAAAIDNPLRPALFKLNGFFPATLTRYRTRRPIITIAVESP